MKVTYNWLKDFVDITVSAQKIAGLLTMAGLEVVYLEERHGDWIFDIEITPNRPDLLSVIGIAREVAAITGKRFRLPRSIYKQRNNKNSSRRLSEQLKISIQDKTGCLLYIARVIKGVNVGDSPYWLRRRLEMLGLRSVNNVVDVTNYILLESGQPLHAFDLGRLQGDSIVVRRAINGEEIITLDGQRRSLDDQILIIADDRKPIAIAGIMGGEGSEVNAATRDILLESAIFNPITIRRASRTLGLSSESSSRFERGVDVQGVDFYSMRAVNLIRDIAGGRLILSKNTTKPRLQKKKIILHLGQLKRMLGADYGLAQTERILGSLSFSIKRHGNNLEVVVPSFRSDIKREVDLIEEVARISGYENIPVRLPRIVPQGVQEEVSFWDKKRVVRNILISQGINEAITYSLLSRDLINKFGYSESQLVLVDNPLTNQQEILRPSIIPALVSRIEYNLNQQQKDIRLFEIGDIFRRDYSESQQEKTSLALVYCGIDINPLYIKGTLELILKRVGVKEFEFTLCNDSHSPYLQKDFSLSLIVNNRILARLGVIKPEILEGLDIKNYIFAAELDLNYLFIEINNAQKQYIPIPIYPEVRRDISIVLKKNILFGEIVKGIVKGRIPYLIEIGLKDCYSGRQIPFGYKGLTLFCIYRADDHTLTAQEIETAHQKVLDILKTAFSAQQR